MKTNLPSTAACTNTRTWWVFEKLPTIEADIRPSLSLGEYRVERRDPIRVCACVDSRGSRRLYVDARDELSIEQSRRLAMAINLATDALEHMPCPQAGFED